MHCPTSSCLSVRLSPVDTLDVITLKWLFSVTMVRRRHMHSLECCRYIKVQKIPVPRELLSIITISSSTISVIYSLLRIKTQTNFYFEHCRWLNSKNFRRARKPQRKKRQMNWMLYSDLFRPCLKVSEKTDSSWMLYSDRFRPCLKVSEQTGTSWMLYSNSLKLMSKGE